MAAFLANNMAPLLVRAPDGSLIPTSGALVDSGAGAPIAGAEGGSAFGDAPVRAAGQGGALVASAAPESNILKFRPSGPQGGGPGPAHNGALIAHPDQPPPIVEGGGGSDPGIGALVSALAGAAGKSGATASIPTPAASNNTGILDKLKDLLGIGSANRTPSNDLTGATAPLPAPVDTGALPPVQNGALADPKTVITARDGSQTTIPTATPESLSAAMAPAAAAAQPPAEEPGFFERNFGGIIDHGDPLTNGPNADTIAARYGSDYKPQDWFDRLRGNGARMALLTGGLATMAEASRPGATVGGAIGKGALQGIGGVYQQREQEKAENLAEEKAASEAELRKHQGAFYDTRGDVAAQNADTGAFKAQTDADYKASRADSESVKAQAALERARKSASGTANPTAMMKNAQFYVDNGIAPDLASAVDMLKTAATNPGQRASLITARTRVLLSSNIMPTDQDVERAKMQAQQQIDAEMKAAAPTKAARSSGGALPAGKQGSGGGQSLPGIPAQSARVVGKTTYVGPDNKTYIWSQDAQGNTGWKLR